MSPNTCYLCLRSIHSPNPPCEFKRYSGRCEQQSRRTGLGVAPNPPCWICSTVFRRALEHARRLATLTASQTTIDNHVHRIAEEVHAAVGQHRNGASRVIAAGANV